jgi:tRNA1(Val) A37 N6-methylase TrmN6
MREASRSVGVSEDAVLGGALRLRQPRRGHRVGHDAILLAAFCPARSGDRVIELGAGVGAAGLALAARVPAVTATLVEIDPELAALATENAALNGLAERVRAITLDVLAPARAFTAAGMAPQSAACVLMNPPFNDPARLRASPDSRRRLARLAAAGTLPGWVKAAARLLRPRGTLTMIFRADALSELVGALGSPFGGLTIQPVYPRPQEPAIRILVRATRDSRAPLVLLPGLTLNDSAGHPGAEAEAVLRAGAALPLAPP